MTDIVCVAVPYWLGKKDDYSGAVETAREMGIAEDINAEWVEIEPDFSAESPVVAVNRALAETVAAYADKDDTMIFVLAGDCTSCLGVMKGLEAFEPDVLWYDAHGDFNTPDTSPSGFLGGMPLAALVGRGNEALIAGIDLEPIAEQRVTITDARDLDPKEATMIYESRIAHFKDIAKVKTIDWANRPLYIHFDTDVVQLDEMPAVRYPADGGASVSQVVDTLQHAITHADVKAVLFTLWDDDHPHSETAANSTLTIIRAAARTVHS